MFLRTRGLDGSWWRNFRWREVYYSWLLPGGICLTYNWKPSSLESRFLFILGVAILCSLSNVEKMRLGLKMAQVTCRMKFLLPTDASHNVRNWKPPVFLWFLGYSLGLDGKVLLQEKVSTNPFFFLFFFLPTLIVSNFARPRIKWQRFLVVAYNVLGIIFHT
jgi:hypothetical protein